MPSLRVRSRFESFLLLSLLSLAAASAAELHGTIKTKGLPFPGVTITALQGDKPASPAYQHPPQHLL